jgi:ribonuclease P protein component
VAAKYSLPGGPRDESGSRSEPGAAGVPGCRSPRSPDETPRPECLPQAHSRRWPREVRLLRRREFERVYSAGRRYGCPLFSAFLVKAEERTSKIGFTAPRTLGRAAQRNRIRRRLREAVRLNLPEVEPGWNIVFNPRRAVAEASFPRLEDQVRAFFRWLAAPRHAGGQEARP